MKIYSADAGEHAAALHDIVVAAHPAEEVQVLESGEVSSVLRVDDVVYKGPHTSLSELSSAVRFDAAVSEALPAAASLATGTVLTMPKLVASHPDAEPPYNVLRYVPGDILNPSHIATFSEAEKTQLGRDLGSFAAWLDRTIPISRFDAIQANTPAGAPTTLTGALRDLRLLIWKQFGLKATTIRQSYLKSCVPCRRNMRILP